MRTRIPIVPYALAISFLGHLAILLIYLPVPPPPVPVDLLREVRIVNAVVMSVPPPSERITAGEVTAAEVVEAEPEPPPAEPVETQPIEPVVAPLVQIDELVPIESAEVQPSEPAGLSAPEVQPLDSTAGDFFDAGEVVLPGAPAAEASPPAVTPAPTVPTVEHGGPAQPVAEAPAGPVSIESRAAPAQPPVEPPAAEQRVFLPFYQVDKRPEPIRSVQPVYPAQALRSNIEGVVILEADIDEQGRIAEVRIIKKAGYGFDEAAAESVRQSTFSPAYVGDRPVPVRLRLTVKFSLND